MLCCGFGRFGVDYLNTCTVKSTDLAILEAGSRNRNGPKFFEPFLQIEGGGLYPLPVKITNKQDGKGASGADVSGALGRRLKLVNTCKACLLVRVFGRHPPPPFVLLLARGNQLV